MNLLIPPGTLTKNKNKKKHEKIYHCHAFQYDHLFGQFDLGRKLYNINNNNRMIRIEEMSDGS